MAASAPTDPTLRRKTKPSATRRRDAAASRRAILDAAETLFAQRGYELTSLGEVGRRAGVSAALPAYFFGGKQALYQAVLERLLSEREQRLEPLAARAADELERTGELRPALELLIDGYVDFLRERTALVRLMGGRPWPEAATSPPDRDIRSPWRLALRAFSARSRRQADRRLIRSSC